MNKQLLRQYIDTYKLHFVYVNQQELYKWQAVKWFQDNWNIDAPDFGKMLVTSLMLTKNLLDSGQYFPRRMITHYAGTNPSELKKLFIDLYNEEENLYARIKNFQTGIGHLSNKLFPDKKTYQDPRAIIVYLALRFPERYFFYKFEMYKGFADKLKLLYRPVKGRVENIGHFNAVCEHIKYEISQDQELLKLHSNRIADDCYYDENLHILTQDFIYAVVKHISPINTPETESNPKVASKSFVKSTDVITMDEPISFVGRVVNFIQNTIDNKRIGDLGEQWVMKYEREKLNRLHKSHLAEKVKHVSREEGDGTGYDVLSFDERDKPIFIEVKTTTGEKNTAFYITRNELERSKVDSESYFLYRLYYFKEETDEADLSIINGDLTNLCEVPVSYKICLLD